MKNSKQCPKCGSSRVYRVNDPTAPHRSEKQGWVHFGKLTDHGRIDRWVCCACGYSEEWVEQRVLDDVEKYWSVRQFKEPK